MAISSAEYWKNREAEQLKHNITDEKEYTKQLEKIYRNMISEIEKQINGFYGKYATTEGITISEAKKRAESLDIEAYSEKAAKYVAEKNFSAKANEEMRLYNMTMKVNRLELLKSQIGLELVSGFNEVEQLFDVALNDRTIAEYERLAGILGDSVRNSAKTANAIVNASFHNATFSDRIWMYQDMLKNELASLLQTGLIQGQNPRQLATHLRKRFGVSQYNAERLMRTELARVQIEAQKQALLDGGFKYYTFLSIETACPECLALDGQHFKLSKMQPGTNAPPIHPNCRCSIAGYENSASYEDWVNALDSGEDITWEDFKNSDTNSSDSGIINSGSSSGAYTDKNDPLYTKRDKHADTYYESVRNSKKGPVVKNIAENSGFSEKYISKVYDHVFINEYDLSGKTQRFDADYDMAESFRRLREGKNIQEHDLILLEHEHLEYGLMNKLGIPYDEAHDLAQSKYNYTNALNEFKKKNNL